MEMGEGVMDSATTCVCPLQRRARSIHESLQNDASGLVELQTQTQKGSFRSNTHYKIVGKENYNPQ